MAVGARVSVDRRSHRSGNAGHGFQAAQPVIDRIIHQRLQLGPSLGANGIALTFDSLRGQAQHNPIEALIGDDQIGALADHAVRGSADLRHLQGLGESLFGCRLERTRRPVRRFRSAYAGSAALPPRRIHWVCWQADRWSLSGRSSCQIIIEECFVRSAFAGFPPEMVQFLSQPEAQ